MRRNDLINYFIKKYNYKSYLEIGVDNPNNCFVLISAEEKVGVDPVKGGTFKMTSDEFFATNIKKFDIIFLDGLHEEPQTKKDVINSLKALNPNGTIIMHDCIPKTEEEQMVPRMQRAWTGNVWKAFAHFRATKKNLSMFVIDSDHGLGVIRKGKQALYTGPKETYEDFENNKNEMLNIKPVESL